MKAVLSPEPIVNREELIERMMGSAAMADRMLARFVDTAAIDCDMLESTVRQGDTDAVASLAHRHKGTAQTLAAPRIARLASQLEQRAQTDSLSDLLQLVDQIRSLHQEVRRAVNNGFDDTTSPTHRISS
jgi:HPt (histidine-containing phosphotransfer) domain-containing protein